MGSNGILALLFALIFLSLSTLCLILPRHVQRYYLDFYESHPEHRDRNPFLSWMNSGGYVVTLRIIGVLCFGFFLLLIATLVFSVWN
jgi:hypothetical protein